ncbi:MAG: hypothetical protein AAF732_08515 [Pseudomonadota bacterium]
MFALTKVLLAAVASLVLMGPALAQQKVEVKSADAVLVPAAKLYRIDDGVFALRPGMSVDLTNRQILLTFDPSPRSAREIDFAILVSGRTMRVRAGTRVDFKRLRATEEFVKDKARCFLDVISYIKPRGAAPKATFRVSCI